MSVYWKLSDEEAEELSGLLYRHYTEQHRKRGGKESAELAMKYWARLAYCVDAWKRNAEPGRLHDCPITLNLDDEQYNRLCALQAAMSSKSPEAALEMAIGVGSKRLIDDRLRYMEWAYREDLEEEKGGEANGAELQ